MGAERIGVEGKVKERQEWTGREGNVLDAKG